MKLCFCINIKREYEKLSQKVEDATGSSHWLDAEDDFEAFLNTKSNDHSTIVKVILQFSRVKSNNHHKTKELIITISLKSCFMCLCEGGMGKQGRCGRRKRGPSCCLHFKREKTKSLSSLQSWSHELSG